MYPEYIGTWNSSIAGIKRTFRTPGGAYRAGRRFARAHGLRLLSPTPFSDTGGIAVTVAFGSLHRVRAIGDLRKLAPMLTLGAPPQYQQSATGLSLLERTYGFVPRTVKPLAIGLQYQALDKGLVQAAEVNTTDGQLESGNYSLLGDPERAFGWGQVVPVVPSRVLRLEGPVFATTIEKVTKLLTQQAMRQLNAAVDVYGKDPAAVAKAFLQAHDLVPLGTS
jgi:osmoprotectant transport system substrate-binding protein